MALKVKNVFSRMLSYVCLIGCLGSGHATAAGPADCDAQLNEQQSTVRQVCVTFLPCQMIYEIFDTCAQSRAWLENLHVTPGAKDVGLQEVGQALSAMGGNNFEEMSDAPTISDCLPSYFDQSRCRQWLGLDPVPVKVAEKAPPRSPDTERRAKVLALYQEAQDARNRSQGVYATTVGRLDNCAASKSFSHREQTCNDAEQQVEACNAYRGEWETRKSAVLVEIDQVQPGVGEEYTPGISPLRGLGPQANSEQQWNDTVTGLRNLDMPPCPATLPGSFLTPAQALEQWAKEDRGEAAAEPDESAVDQAEQEHEVQDAEEAAAELERRRLAQEEERLAESAEEETGGALERETSGEISDLFEGAVNQAEQEGQVRDAEEEAAELEQQRLAQEAEALADQQRAEQERLAEAAAASALRQPAEQEQLAAIEPESNGTTISSQPPFGWDCNLLKGKWMMTSSSNPGASLIFSSEVSGDIYTSTILEVTGIDGASDTTGSCSDFTRDNRLSSDAMTISLAFGDGSWVFTRLSPIEGGTVPTSTAGTSPVSQNCQAGLANLEAEFTAINQRNPGTGEVIPGLQTVLYMLNKMMQFMDQTCKGTPQYSGYASYKQQYDSTMTTCLGTASSPDYCVPKLGW